MDFFTSAFEAKNYNIFRNFIKEFKYNKTRNKEIGSFFTSLILNISESYE